MTQEVYVALDIGGTKLMAAAITPERKIVARERAATPKSLDDGIQLVKTLIRQVTQGVTTLAIGASAGGPLDHVRGIVSALHFPEWRGVPLKKIIEEEFGVPFSVDVDTNVAALAEYRFGAHSADRLLYVTLSTGVGGGFIIDGEIYRGANGSHPEVGHVAIPFELPTSGPVRCACGALNCLEAIVSGTSVRKIYGKLAEDLLPEEWDQVAFNLGQGLRNMAAVYAPSTIVIGGGMGIGGGERLLSGARRVLEENLRIVPVPALMASTLGYDTALWGAFALASGA